MLSSGRVLPTRTRARMILDSLATAHLYRPLSPRFSAGLDYLAAFDPATADGRYELDGDRLFALVQSYDTAPGTEKRFESHRRYADIQFVAAGTERILYIPVASLTVDSPHDADNDIAFFQEPPASTSLLLRAGDFAVFYPQDAHKPGCMAGGRDPVKKVVVKVEV